MSQEKDLFFLLDIKVVPENMKASSIFLNNTLIIFKGLVQAPV